MAYVGLGHLREARDFRTALAAVASPSVLARSALIAVAAAAAILALSDGGATTAEQPQLVATKKADRLVATTPLASSQAAIVNDAKTQTTTAARGAVIPFGASSPIGAGHR
ncbi:hypothetical protein [Hansschlegelia zhihuaiae]|uniref:Uncharacterized protein n=1 Tax=Hansschlegelia zhihuaiae TaxID=405005 RepID=A0A4Q0MJE0_9HYPH|nr:hypothetical protein [Hansschlegelia zhihuaiae]RXF73503.1 hypothetical protein EK403_09925 [Hansschlegelia zhihuaiae]